MMHLVLRERYPGVLYLSRFLGRTDRLSDVDKLASVRDHDSASEVLRQVGEPPTSPTAQVDML